MLTVSVHDNYLQEESRVELELSSVQFKVGLLFSLACMCLCALKNVPDVFHIGLISDSILKRSAEEVDQTTHSDRPTTTSEEK
jgi:hypothetical protein